MSTTNDKIEWIVGPDGSTLDSDDFEHDVILHISGDFSSDEQRREYANNLAMKLNAPN